MPRNSTPQEYRTAIIKGMADHLWEVVWKTWKWSSRRPRHATSVEPAEDLARLVEAANGGRRIGELFLGVLHRDYRPTQGAAEKFGNDVARLALEGRGDEDGMLRIPRFTISYDPSRGEVEWDGSIGVQNPLGVSAPQEYRRAIIKGMARRVWVVAWTDYATEIDVGLLDRDGNMPRSWEDAAPRTPAQAEAAAQDLAKLLETANGTTVESLFIEAWNAPIEPIEGNLPRILVLAVNFGDDLAADALGTREFPKGKDIAIPRFTAKYDGEFLTWESNYDNKMPPIHNPGVERILIIEDEPARQADMQRLFKRIYPAAIVDVVDNALDANAAIDTRSFDLIVSDWDLADGTTGGDVLDHVRDKHPELVNRFLFASGNAAVQDVHSHWIMKGEITKAAMIDAIGRLPRRNPSGCRCAGHQ